MGDVNDRCAALDYLTDAAEQHVGSVTVQRGGGLVKDQHLGIERQRLGDLKQLFLRDTQCVTPRLQRNRQANRVQNFAGEIARWTALEQSVRKRYEQIFQH